MEKRLTRSRNRMLGGVCAGLAEFFGLDPTLVRLFFVFFGIFAGGGVLLYILLWIIVPLEQRKQSFEGKPRNNYD
jgi:phage shock protein C